MKCPFCRHDGTSVVDSREVKEGGEIRRRRECFHCKKRFTTYERPDAISLFIVKKDGRREPFDPEKIRSGIMKAIEKRPVSIHSADEAVQEVVEKLMTLGEREIPSRVIGEEVMRVLKRLDEVAYVRFASVYRQFKDINDFMSELNSLLTKKK